MPLCLSLSILLDLSSLFSLYPCHGKRRRYVMVPYADFNLLKLPDRAQARLPPLPPLSLTVVSQQSIND